MQCYSFPLVNSPMALFLPIHLQVLDAWQGIPLLTFLAGLTYKLWCRSLGLQVRIPTLIVTSFTSNFRHRY